MPVERLTKDFIFQLQQSYRDIVTLDLSNNAISVVENLDTLNQLANLDLSFNTISVVQNLGSLKHLVTLNLSHNNVSEVDGMDPLQRLNTLDLSHNQITELVPLLQQLAPLRSLRHLRLNDNPASVNDDHIILVLKTLTQLESLDGISVEQILDELERKQEAAVAHLGPQGPDHSQRQVHFGDPSGQESALNLSRHHPSRPQKTLKATDQESTEVESTASGGISVPVVQGHKVPIRDPEKQTAPAHQDKDEQGIRLSSKVGERADRERRKAEREKRRLERRERRKHKENSTQDEKVGKQSKPSRRPEETPRSSMFSYNPLYQQPGSDVQSQLEQLLAEGRELQKHLGDTLEPQLSRGANASLAVGVPVVALEESLGTTSEGPGLDPLGFGDTLLSNISTLHPIQLETQGHSSTSDSAHTTITEGRFGHGFTPTALDSTGQLVVQKSPSLLRSLRKADPTPSSSDIAPVPGAQSLPASYRPPKSHHPPTETSRLGVLSRAGVSIRDSAETATTLGMAIGEEEYVQRIMELEDDLQRAKRQKDQQDAEVDGLKNIIVQLELKYQQDTDTTKKCEPAKEDTDQDDDDTRNLLHPKEVADQQQQAEFDDPSIHILEAEKLKLQRQLEDSEKNLLAAHQAAQAQVQKHESDMAAFQSKIEQAVNLAVGAKEVQYAESLASASQEHIQQLGSKTEALERLAVQMDEIHAKHEVEREAWQSDLQALQVRLAEAEEDGVMKSRAMEEALEKEKNKIQSFESQLKGKERELVERLWMTEAENAQILDRLLGLEAEKEKLEHLLADRKAETRDQSEGKDTEEQALSEELGHLRDKIRQMAQEFEEKQNANAIALAERQAENAVLQSRNERIQSEALVERGQLEEANRLLEQQLTVCIEQEESQQAIIAQLSEQQHQHKQANEKLVLEKAEEEQEKQRRQVMNLTLLQEQSQRQKETYDAVCEQLERCQKQLTDIGLRDEEQIAHSKAASTIQRKWRVQRRHAECRQVQKIRVAERVAQLSLDQALSRNQELENTLTEQEQAMSRSVAFAELEHAQATELLRQAEVQRDEVALECENRVKQLNGQLKELNMELGNVQQSLKNCQAASEAEKHSHQEAISSQQAEYDLLLQQSNKERAQIEEQLHKRVEEKGERIKGLEKEIEDKTEEIRLLKAYFLYGAPRPSRVVNGSDIKSDVFFGFDDEEIESPGNEHAEGKGRNGRIFFDEKDETIARLRVQVDALSEILKLQERVLSNSAESPDDTPGDSEKDSASAVSAGEDGDVVGPHMTSAMQVAALLQRWRTQVYKLLVQEKSTAMAIEKEKVEAASRENGMKLECEKMKVAAAIARQAERALRSEADGHRTLAQAAKQDAVRAQARVKSLERSLAHHQQLYDGLLERVRTGLESAKRSEHAMKKGTAWVDAQATRLEFMVGRLSLLRTLLAQRGIVWKDVSSKMAQHSSTAQAMSDSNMVSTIHSVGQLTDDPLAEALRVERQRLQQERTFMVQAAQRDAAKLKADLDQIKQDCHTEILKHTTHVAVLEAEVDSMRNKLAVVEKERDDALACSTELKVRLDSEASRASALASTLEEEQQSRERETLARIQEVTVRTDEREAELRALLGEVRRESARHAVCSRDGQRELARVRDELNRSHESVVSELQIRLRAKEDALQAVRSERNSLLAVVRQFERVGFRANNVNADGQVDTTSAAVEGQSSVGQSLPDDSTIVAAQSPILIAEESDTLGQTDTATADPKQPGVPTSLAGKLENLAALSAKLLGNTELL